MSVAVIAAAILADRERTPTTRHNIVPCFVCGHTYIYRGRKGDLNGRFCSMRCQSWYDAGGGPVSDEIVYRWRNGKPMKKGSQGFYVDCARCHKEFECKGLRCCSAECERALRQRQDNLALMAEAGIAVQPKRQCTQCGAHIPRWRRGRQVSSSTRFCSPRCAQRARRAAA